MTYQIGKFTTKTTNDVRDDVLRVVRNGMISSGISTNPQLGPGSDEYFWAIAIANEAAPLYANTVIKADQVMPDTAAGVAPAGQSVGADLQRVMAIYKLAPRPAVPSSGYITLSCSASTIIPSTSQLIDASGLRYQVQSSGTYSNGDLVPVIAVDTGTVTDHSAGDTLTWVAAPPYCASKQLVATGGLTGGADAETNEPARARLLDRLQNPPGSGNPVQIAGWAEASTPIVQKAFVYPAVNGPSTVHVAVTGYTSSTSQSRAVDATVMSGTVVPFVAGKIFGGAEVVTTATVDQPVDVAIGLTLPSAPTASPPGPGGGWIDGSPWPAISGSANTYANVTAVTSTTKFTVNAPTAPADNVSHICMWDSVQGKLLRAKVLSHTGTAGAYLITIDTAFPNVSASGLGTFIFPDATNMQTYLNALLSAFESMGPGEKTANVSVLTRGFRHPTPQSAWPYSLGATQLKQVEDTGSEVLDTDWYYKSATTPTVPAAVSNSPNILTPRLIGFYPI